MVAKTRRVGAALLCLAIASVAAAQEVQTPERAIAGRYIVVLNDQQVARANVRPVVEDLARQYGGRIAHVYENTIRGFAVAISATGAAALARHPQVRYVEQDSERFVVETQAGATWGLDRIDQRDLPLNGSYMYTTPAANVHAYVIDTGIRETHSEFAGRMSNGFSAISDGRGTTDCNGHGTHVSGTIGGTTYGAAKAVTLHAVRVLDCSGSGSTAGVIAGVDWVTANHIKPAVANMSLGGGASTALDDAIRGSVAAGVTYAVAAGNSNTSACSSSPARVSQALTVGSSTNADARSSFSNFGSCVDLFAPGSNITSAWSTSDTAVNTISGTSMATPHVTGAAALYLADHPLAPVSEVHAAVVNNASVNKLSNVGSGSPNRLLFSVFNLEPGDTPPVANFTASCNERTCSFDSTSTDDHGIITYAWDFGDGSTDTTSGTHVDHTYQSNGTFTVRLTVTDTANQTDTETRSVTVSGGGAPCTGCQEYTGTLSGPGDFDYHPNGSYYLSSVSGVHRGWLRGPSNADFDLYLQKWNGLSWVTVARSEGSTSVEQIAYTGTTGFYRWRIYSFQGSGGYSFWLQRP